jgi:N-acylneuraminate cytidylyltransferase/CMP-N,N'-diacetyllegionaminic acid synthase
VFYPDTQLFEMPQERSVDIDSELDYALVELLLQKRQLAGTGS